MYFFSSKLYFRVLSVFLLTFVFVSFSQTVYSQKTKPKQEKKSSATKPVEKKPAAKTGSKTAAAKNSSKTTASKSKTATTKTNNKTTGNKNAKPAAADNKSSKTSSKNSQTPIKKETRAETRKRLADEKKKAAANSAKNRAAQQAALEEKRRRDQAIRAAQARKQALENSFRDETAVNILKDDITGEDMEIRRAALNALGSRAGTIVVMEAQTGKILSIVNQEWAIRESFKPCSTIKLVTAVAGMDKDLIDSEGNVKNKKFSLNLTDALAYSNNTYFQAVGSDLGSETMISYAKRLGLGQPTGVNADGETAGKLPFGNNNARIYSHGDDFAVTPLQLGVMVSAISNGGKVVVPQIVRSKVQKTSFRGNLSRTIELPKDNLRSVIPGMIGAAEYGTARRGVDSTLGVAGKTGSCIENGSWVGLFASVAPVANPEYAVIVITRGQNERGKYAAAIAGNIYQVLAKRMDKTSVNQARELLVLKPKPKVNAITAAEMDENKDEDSEDNDVAIPKKEETVKKIQNDPANVKPDSQEIFPPVVIRVKDPARRPRIIDQN